MCEMSPIRVEAWRTVRQMIAYRFVALRRSACQNPQRIIRRAAFTLRIRKSVSEIETGKLKELMFSLEDSTFLRAGCHTENFRRPMPAYFNLSFLLIF